MANFEALHRWSAFVPDLGNNRQLDAGEQLVLEVATGLPHTELKALSVELNSGDVDRIKAALARNIRLVGGPHKLGDATVTTLGEYFDVVSKLAGQYNLRELYAAVGHYNSLAESEVLFSERRSGGTAFMPPRSAAKNDGQTEPH